MEPVGALGHVLFSFTEQLLMSMGQLALTGRFYRLGLQPLCILCASSFPTVSHVHFTLLFMVEEGSRTVLLSSESQSFRALLCSPKPGFCHPGRWTHTGVPRTGQVQTCACFTERSHSCLVPAREDGCCWFCLTDTSCCKFSSANHLLFLLSPAIMKG